MIDEIQKGTEETNEAEVKERKLVDMAVEKTTEANRQFKNIKKSVEQIIIKIGDMARASKQQSVIAEEMSKAMDEITEATVENASASVGINETLGMQAKSFVAISSNAKNIKKFAKELKELTNKFKV